MGGSSAAGGKSDWELGDPTRLGSSLAVTSRSEPQETRSNTAPLLVSVGETRYLQGIFFLPEGKNLRSMEAGQLSSLWGSFEAFSPGDSSCHHSSLSPALSTQKRKLGTCSRVCQDPSSAPSVSLPGSVLNQLSWPPSPTPTWKSHDPRLRKSHLEKTHPGPFLEERQCPVCPPTCMQEREVGGSEIRA